MTNDGSKPPIPSHPTTETQAAGGTPRADAPRIGRAIGIGLFWLMALHVIGTSTYSVINQLFWPGEQVALPEERICAEQLRRLQDELLDGAGARLHHGSRAELQRWLSAWDHRFGGLPQSCGSLQRAREDLLVLRTDIEQMLRDYQTSESPVRDRIEQALELFATPTSS